MRENASRAPLAAFLTACAAAPLPDLNLPPAPRVRNFAPSVSLDEVNLEDADVQTLCREMWDSDLAYHDTLSSPELRFDRGTIRASQRTISFLRILYVLQSVRKKAVEVNCNFDLAPMPPELLAIMRTMRFTRKDIASTEPSIRQRILEILEQGILKRITVITADLPQDEDAVVLGFPYENTVIYEDFCSAWQYTGAESLQCSGDHQMPDGRPDFVFGADSTLPGGKTVGIVQRLEAADLIGNRYPEVHRQFATLVAGARVILERDHKMPDYRSAHHPKNQRKP